MLGINRHAASYTFTAIVVILAVVLVYLLRETIFVFILAVLFAYLLTPLVNVLDGVLPGRTRAPALALSYIIFIGLTGFIAFKIGSTAVEQANHLIKALPGMLAAYQPPKPNAPLSLTSMKDELIGRVRSVLSERSSDIVSAIPQYTKKALSVASYLIYVVIIPILAFFFLKDGKQMRVHMLEMFDQGPRRVLVDEILADIDLLLAHYMRALFALSVAAFTAYSISFSLMGVPFSILLAAIAGMLEFIPMVGPLTAAVIIVILTGASGANVLPVLIFLVIYRCIQDYILSPYLMGSGVELHPLLVLFGVFAGAEIAGIAGTFLSVPILALVRILYMRLRRRRIATRELIAPELRQ